MATRALVPRAVGVLATASPSAVRSARQFQTSARGLEAATALPARKPVGAFRGGLFGFFLGSSAAAFGLYYYVLTEYKASNKLLTEDIYALQNAVDRLTHYVTVVEEKMETLEKKKK